MSLVPPFLSYTSFYSLLPSLCFSDPGLRHPNLPQDICTCCSLARKTLTLCVPYSLASFETVQCHLPRWPFVATISNRISERGLPQPPSLVTWLHFSLLHFIFSPWASLLCILSYIHLLTFMAPYYFPEGRNRCPGFVACVLTA